MFCVDWKYTRVQWALDRVGVFCVDWKYTRVQWALDRVGVFCSLLC